MPTENTGNEQDEEGQTGLSQSLPGANEAFGLTPRPKVRSQRVDPLLGIDLGGVKIIRLIGEGGMGRVYEALQERPSRTVAVKVIRQGITSEKTMRRFEREAEFLGKLQHPGIAQIFIVGTYSSDFGDVPFYVMEFIPNAKPITNYAHEHGLTLGEKLGIFSRVCEAVSHGHDRSIVHRDLKPGNILVDGSGNPKVIDFGVARSTDSDLALNSMKTDTGQMVGTVQYMSPEQFGPDPDDLDGRTDVYSLGVVLYELISGSPPYVVRRKALHEASRVVCEQVPVPLRSVDKSVPREVSAIAERCLQKDPRHRYHNAGELAADLGRFLEGKPVKARPLTVIGRLLASSERLRPRVSRKAGGILLFGLVAAAGVAQFSGVIPLDRQALLSLFPQPPQQVSREISSDWRPIGLTVREGACYRLTVAGTCTDGFGDSFGPEGSAPREFQTLWGPPNRPSGFMVREPQPAMGGPSAAAIRDAFVDGHPRQSLLAKVAGSDIVMGVGAGLTFIAPASGELSFRVNERKQPVKPGTGILAFGLEHVSRPEFVDKEGRCSISAPVMTTAYLIFVPNGLQWESSFLSDSGLDFEYPTLINGIAWWPERDFQDIVRSKVLKTKDFAWAADPGRRSPVIVSPPSKESWCSVVVKGPEPETAGLTFSACPGVRCVVSCVISKPQGESGR